jgi:hypothetical protein
MSRVNHAIHAGATASPGNLPRLPARIVKLLTSDQPSWLATAAIERQSRRSGNPADVGPHLERTRPCGSMLAGGDVVAAEMEEQLCNSLRVRRLL